MKTGPRYIGVVNYASIVTHIEELALTDEYKIKMNPIDFEKLVVEYKTLFTRDFNEILNIKGVPFEKLQETPVNRICVVTNNSDSCSL